MTKKANKHTRTNITTIAVIVSAIVAVIAILSLRSGYLAGRAIGGEIMFLFLPLIVYGFCKNITLSVEVLSNDKDEFTEYRAQAVTQPKSINSQEPKLFVTFNNSCKAEDYN